MSAFQALNVGCSCSPVAHATGKGYAGLPALIEMRNFKNGRFRLGSTELISRLFILRAANRIACTQSGFVLAERDGYIIGRRGLSVCPEIRRQHGSKAFGLDRHDGAGQFWQQTFNGAAGQ